ncbi:MAG: hypothetical protein E6I75_10865 [Chloroflexi bacterium]|nr:MAG: hypothetical protein E6I75_10865 [Chloroflexota bacterium]
MRDIELVLGLLVLVAALALLARRLGTPYPIVLVVGGLMTALVPGLPDVELAPELVFLPRHVRSPRSPSAWFWPPLPSSRWWHTRWCQASTGPSPSL